MVLPYFKNKLVSLTDRGKSVYLLEFLKKKHLFGKYLPKILTVFFIAYVRLDCYCEVNRWVIRLINANLN